MKSATKAFGSELRDLREAKGFGLRELAKKARISPAFLSKVERGEITPPAERKLKSLAKALDYDADALMTLAGRLPGDVLEIIQRHPAQYIALLRDLKELDAQGLERLREHTLVWILTGGYIPEAGVPQPAGVDLADLIDEHGVPQPAGTASKDAEACQASGDLRWTGREGERTK